MSSIQGCTALPHRRNYVPDYFCESFLASAYSTLAILEVDPLQLDHRTRESAEEVVEKKRYLHALRDPKEDIFGVFSSLRGLA